MARYDLSGVIIVDVLMRSKLKYLPCVRAQPIWQ